MKKILIIGSGPLPSQKNNKCNAFILRTIQYHEALKASLKDQELRLITLTKQKKEASENCLYNKDKSAIQKIVNEYQPDIVLGVNIEGSFVASSIKTKAKIICDLNGWTMAEGQAQAKNMNNDGLLGHLWAKEKKCLLNGDFFLTVSDAQKYATYGALASIGRLNKGNFGVEMVKTVRNSRASIEPKQSKVIKADDKVNVCWIGGYNNWADEKTLFQALEYAMSRDERISFISTGGKIEKLDDSTFSRFQARVNKSKHRDRYKFLGWVKNEEIPKIYKNADIGINVDFNCAETWFGARNRINEMMSYGIPVVSTGGSEISKIVRSSNSGIVSSNQDFESLGKAILNLAAKPEMRLEMGLNGIKHIKDNNYSKSCSELIELINNIDKYSYKKYSLGLQGFRAKLKSILTYIKIRLFS